jgi:riboflavin kinase/FMN adenylyltransferase
MIKIIHNTKQIKNLNGSIVTIGNFDGIHLGHQALIKQCNEEAKKLNLPQIIILFEPQPQEYFQPQNPPARLMRLREKIEYLKNFSIDYIYVLRFNKKFSMLRAEDFIQEILIAHLKTKVLFIGEDFHFGYQRQGNITLLKKVGLDFGFKVNIIPTKIQNGEKISSTLIREKLAKGNIQAATSLLGHPFWLSGHVMHGLGIGKQLNCPTLNIALCRNLSPIFGIFVVYVKTQTDKIFKGVACIGFRPTLGQHQALLEVHLLDIDQNMYGKLVHIFFLKKLRDEEKFSSKSALQAAIQKDIEQSRKFFLQSPQKGDFLEFIKWL